MALVDVAFNQKGYSIIPGRGGVTLALTPLYKRRLDFLCYRAVPVPVSYAEVVQRAVSELEQPLRSSWRCSICSSFAA